MFAGNNPRMRHHAAHAVPQQCAKSPCRAEGVNLTRAKCEAFSASVTTTAAYTQFTEIQRMKQMTELFGTAAQAAQIYTQPAAITYAAVNKISTGESATSVWDSKVLDIFDSALKTRTENITAEAYEFELRDGQTAQCSFVYSTIDLRGEHIYLNYIWRRLRCCVLAKLLWSVALLMAATQTSSPCILCCPVPYVAAVAFFFDGDGATSWKYSFPAQYQAGSYTNIERIITVKSAKGKTGELNSMQLPCARIVAC